MSRYESASHIFYRCQYHIVWKPKYRHRILKGRVGQEVCRSIYIYSGMKRCRIVELNVQIDHVHLLVRLPPSLSVFSGSKRRDHSSICKVSTESRGRGIKRSDQAWFGWVILLAPSRGCSKPPAMQVDFLPRVFVHVDWSITT